MTKTQVLDRIALEFINYLEKSNISPISLKNYRSDLNHFSSWIIIKAKSYGVFAESLTDCIPLFNQDVGKDYRKFLLDNLSPNQTVNRRLSTLRNLSKFLVSTQIIDFDFMDGLSGTGLSSTTKSVDPLIDKFEKYLEKEKASKNTIKNYLADVKHFISWVNERSATN